MPLLAYMIRQGLKVPLRSCYGAGEFSLSIIPPKLKDKGIPTSDARVVCLFYKWIYMYCIQYTFTYVWKSIVLYERPNTTLIWRDRFKRKFVFTWFFREIEVYPVVQSKKYILFFHGASGIEIGVENRPVFCQFLTNFQCWYLKT